MVWGDPQDLEAAICDRSEYSQELEISQVAPRYRVPGSAYLKIREGCEAEVEAALTAMDENLHTLLQVCAGLPTAGAFVHVGHESERTYAGYGNALRAVQALARWLEDARFFITERSEASWIDELRIVEGVLAYRRLEIEEVQDEPTLRRRELRKDRELREFLAWRIARELGRGDREGMADRDLHVTARREALAKAEALDPDGHEVLFQRGCIERAAGEHRVALGWFMRAARIEDPLLTDRLAMMAATAIAAGDRETARAWLDRAVTGRPDQTAWILRGYLRGLDEDFVAAAAAPVPDREVLPWTLCAEDVLRAFAECSAISPVPRARALFGWAELYRIRTCHGLREPESRALAEHLYGLADAADPLGGEIAYHQVIHRHGHDGEAALAGFEAVLERFPEELSALFGAACGLAKRKAWARAVELLRRYERAVGQGRSYERGAARSQLVGCLHMDACERLYERGDYGAGPEQLLDEAIALTGRDSRWEGPWVAKGDLYEYRRDHAAALRLYETAVARNPRSVHAWSGKGSCLNNLGRTAEALSCLDRALGLDRHYWHVHYAKACTLARSGGDAEEILALVRRAVTLEPTRRRQIVEDPDLTGLAIPSEWT